MEIFRGDSRQTIMVAKLIQSIRKYSEKKKIGQIHECAGEYSVQAIMDSKSGEDWNSRIHAFGYGRNKRGLYKILKIYATLRKRSDTAVRSNEAD